MFIEKKAKIRIVMNGNLIHRKIKGNSILVVAGLANTLAHAMKSNAKPGVSDEELVQDMAEMLLDMMKEEAANGHQ